MLLLSSAGRASLVDRLQYALRDRHSEVDLRATMHVPHGLVHEVLADASANGIDLVVAIGGGSAIGLAKAIALNEGPPFIAIPTTYSGSEMTPIWGVTRDGIKTTGRDEIVRPVAVLYDPELSADLPYRIAVPSALNALAHCMEALYAPDVNPVATMAASEGACSIVNAMRLIAGDNTEAAVRSQLLLGAYLAGLALGMVQMGLHHKLCHVLGGSFGLPHAETHAIMLPYTHEFNARAAAAALEPLWHSLDASTPVEASQALHSLVDSSLQRAGAPQSLADIGFDIASSGRVAELATASAYANPRTFNREQITLLLQKAAARAGVTS